MTRPESFSRLSPLALATGTAAASIVAVILHLLFRLAQPYGMYGTYMAGPFGHPPAMMHGPIGGFIFLAAIGAIVLAGVFGAIVAAVYNWTILRLQHR
ncbi:MAG TPA: hypothetical protein VGR69_02835 [Candidatus Rubrimentiphilum sp.]|nr:hypothetical protein [Candidatus Rubrimentiphilum sp.]